MNLQLYSEQNAALMFNLTCVAIYLDAQFTVEYLIWLNRLSHKMRFTFASMATKFPVYITFVLHEKAFFKSMVKQPVKTKVL